MKKNLDSYGETLFHLINFRSRQFRDSRSMIGIDYESFIILSTVGAHYLTHNTKQGSTWDSVWETTRQEHVGEFYSKKEKRMPARKTIGAKRKRTQMREGGMVIEDMTRIIEV